jgi:hypothetical protein
MCILTNTNSSMKIILSERQKELLNKLKEHHGPVACSNCGHTFTPDDDTVTCNFCHHENKPVLLEENNLKKILAFAIKKGWGDGKIDYVHDIKKDVKVHVQFEIEQMHVDELNEALYFEIINLDLKTKFTWDDDWIGTTKYTGSGITKAISSYFDVFRKYYSVQTIVVNSKSPQVTLIYQSGLWRAE